MGERVQSKKSFICTFSECSASFSKSWKLEAHICKHTGLKPFPCVDCDKHFCTGYELSKHQLSHSGEKPHKCQAEGCVEAFVTHSSMKNHMCKMHQNEGKPYKCGHKGCGADFNKRHQLKAHTYEHTKLLPFHCTFIDCTKEFPTHGKLECHKKIHKGYSCEEDGCPFQGKTWSDYQTHKKEHRVKVQCDKCQKQFYSHFLRLHELHVHLDVRKGKLACPRGCDKRFVRQVHLESHVLSEHGGTRAFSCVSPGCGKSFAMKESLWRHSVVHDPERRKIKKLQSKNKKLSHKTPADGCVLAANLGHLKLADS